MDCGLAEPLDERMITGVFRSLGGPDSGGKAKCTPGVKGVRMGDVSRLGVKGPDEQIP